MEKQALFTSSSLPGPHADTLHPPRRSLPAWPRSTRAACHRRTMFLFVTAILLTSTMLAVRSIAQGAGRISSARVPLEAHIMSKCPDAKDCLLDLLLPVMQQVSGTVDFQLSFIGNITDHDNGVACMHGPEECLGNIVELCAARVYPDPKIYLAFTACITREYAKIPQRELLENCALEHGIDFQKINECATDDDGQLAVDRLKASFTHSSSVGVTKSCTIRLNNKVRCIRDDGKWSDCERGSTPADLVKDILALSA